MERLLKLQTLFFFSRERCGNQFVGVAHEFEDAAVGQFAIETYAYPMFFVHVVSGFYVVVECLQFLNAVGIAFDYAEVEYVHIHEAEPFVGDREYEQIAVVFRGGFSEWHFVGDAFERQTVSPEIFDIHNVLIVSGIANI